jgi:tRNA G10  N-methylase Trm11
MKTTLQLKRSQLPALPAALQPEEVRYSESLVECFLQEYTRPGDTVLDPFAGFGTTLRVAERLGRRAFGVELTEEKVLYARSQLAHPEHLIHGDTRHLADLDLPPIDFSMTSPPYMAKDDLPDPFQDYRVKGQGYAAYLRDLRRIYGQLRQRMKPAGTVVLEVANLKLDGRVTTLAWDVAQEIGRVLRFEGEVVVGWDTTQYGYEHSYCLVFSAL